MVSKKWIVLSISLTITSFLFAWIYSYFWLYVNHCEYEREVKVHKFTVTELSIRNTLDPNDRSFFCKMSNILVTIFESHAINSIRGNSNAGSSERFDLYRTEICIVVPYYIKLYLDTNLWTIDLCHCSSACPKWRKSLSTVYERMTISTFWRRRILLRESINKETFFKSNVIGFCKIFFYH